MFQVTEKDRQMESDFMKSIPSLTYGARRLWSWKEPSSRNHYFQVKKLTSKGFGGCPRSHREGVGWQGRGSHPKSWKNFVTEKDKTQVF